jgi:hypothetical protein
MTLPAGSQSMAMGGMGVRAQGMDGRKKGVLRVFVAETYGVVTADPQSLPVPATAAVGDLAIVTASSNTSTWSLTGGTTIRSTNYGPGYGYGLFSKILTATDLLSGLSLSGNTTGAFHVVVLRNVTNAADKGATAGFTATDPSSPGFAKSPNHKGTFAVLISRFVPTITSPVGSISGTAVSESTTWQTWALLSSPMEVPNNTPIVWRGNAPNYYVATTTELT